MSTAGRPSVIRDQLTKDVSERPDGGLDTPSPESTVRPESTIPAESTERQNVPVASTAAANADPESSPLFAREASSLLWQKWDAIQTGFVDQPRRAVEEADSLVSETMKQLADSFAQARTTLEEHWSRGNDVSTEELRVALQRYRSFFRRLLAV